MSDDEDKGAAGSSRQVGKSVFRKDPVDELWEAQEGLTDVRTAAARLDGVLTVNQDDIHVWTHQESSDDEDHGASGTSRKAGEGVSRKGLVDELREAQESMSEVCAPTTRLDWNADCQSG